MSATSMEPVPLYSYGPYSLWAATMATLPYFIGLTCSLVLFGILACQIVTYFNAFPKYPESSITLDYTLSSAFGLGFFYSDKRTLRRLVLYVFLIETAMTFYDTWNIGDHIIHPRLDDPTNQEARHGTYHEPARLSYQNPYAPPAGSDNQISLLTFQSITPSRSARPDTILTASISTPVQLFYAWRLHSLQASKKLTYSIYGFSVISLISAVITAVTSPRGIPPVVHDYETRKSVHTGPQGKLLAPTLIWLGSSAFADLLVTGGISYILLRSKTGFRRTDSKVSKIIQCSLSDVHHNPLSFADDATYLKVTLETGLLTSTCILLEIVLFLLQQTGIIGGFRGINYDDSAYYMIPDLILSKLYANMLLATLNARAQWRASSGSASASIEIRREEIEAYAHALQRMSIR